MGRCLLIGLGLLLMGCSALACPLCAYERMAYWWPTAVGIRLALGALVVANRLDVVRVLGVLLGYEFLWYHAYRFLIWYGDPGWHSPFTDLCTVGLVLLQLGVFGAGLLFLLGRFSFFRRNPGLGLPWWQALLYLPAGILAQVLAPSAH